MGGNAIKSARRFKKDEFFSAAEVLLPKLEQIFKTKVHLCQSFKNKDSFGDMDVLVYAENLNHNTEELLNINFNNPEIFHNSNVWSFNYNELQVDLIFTSPSNWETAISFYSYGDLSNFIGKLFNNYGKMRKYRLRYGYDGLKVSLFENDCKFGSVYLSKDTKRCLEFMGLSYQKFLDGFDDINDVFEYIQTSKYFEGSSFLFENLNHENKNRNKRRPNYILLLDYLEKNNITTKLKWDKTEEEYFEDVLNFFSNTKGELRAKVEEEYAKRKRNLAIKEKFNGTMVMEKFGVKGIELGDMLKKFNDSFSDAESRKIFIENTELSDIFEYFRKVNSL